MSESNRATIAYFEESNFGVIEPGNPTFKEVPITSEDLAQNSTFEESQTIRNDRQKVDVIRTAINAGGPVPFELIYSAFDEWFQYALLSSGFSSIVTSTEVTYSMVAAGNSIDDSGSAFVSDGFLQFQWVEIRGFTGGNATNLGFFKILTVAAGVMGLAGATVVNESAGDSVTITMGAQILNGTTKQSLNIEREYTDLSNIFSIFTGQEIDQLNISVNAQGIATGSFQFVGKDEASAAATAGDGANTAAASNQVMNTVDHVESIKEAQANAAVLEFTFALSNNLFGRVNIGDLGPTSMRAGSVAITGTIKQYFETVALYDKYLAATATNLAIVFEDTAGNAYVMEFPQVRITAGKRANPGIDGDIIADFTWTAYRNVAENVTIRITRFVA